MIGNIEPKTKECLGQWEFSRSLLPNNWLDLRFVNSRVGRDLVLDIWHDSSRDCFICYYHYYDLINLLFSVQVGSHAKWLTTSIKVDFPRRLTSYIKVHPNWITLSQSEERTRLISWRGSLVLTEDLNDEKRWRHELTDNEGWWCFR